MTAPQAALAIGIHRTRIWQLIRNGTIKAEKVGRDWLIDEVEVERVKGLPSSAVGRPRKPAMPPHSPPPTGTAP